MTRQHKQYSAWLKAALAALRGEQTIKSDRKRRVPAVIETASTGQYSVIQVF